MKQKQGIEYSQVSWNPFTGCENIENGSCSVGEKCWAYGMSKRQAGRNGYDKDKPFKPTFHEDKLHIPLNRKKPTIFNVSFMGDIAYAKKEWLKKIIAVINSCPQHRFIFLTKSPDVLAEKEITFPDNCIVGVTVNRQDDVCRIGNLFDIDCAYMWVSFEPLYSSVLANLKDVDWIVIGAQTNPELQPKIGWVSEIVMSAEVRGIPVFMKPNLKCTYNIQELPMMLKEIIDER